MKYIWFDDYKYKFIHLKLCKDVRFHCRTTGYDARQILSFRFPKSVHGNSGNDAHSETQTFILLFGRYLETLSTQCNI